MEPKEGDIASFKLRQIGRKFPMNGSQSGMGAATRAAKF